MKIKECILSWLENGVDSVYTEFEIIKSEDYVSLEFIEMGLDGRDYVQAISKVGEERRIYNFDEIKIK